MRRGKRRILKRLTSLPHRVFFAFCLYTKAKTITAETGRGARSNCNDEAARLKTEWNSNITQTTRGAGFEGKYQLGQKKYIYPDDQSDSDNQGGSLE